MTTATRCERIHPDVWRWWAFSPEHRVEWMTHAVRGDSVRWVVFDPIPLEVLKLPWEGGIEALVLTNGNHERAAEGWRERFGCPVFAPSGLDWAMTGVALPDAGMPEGWTAVPLTGGAPGETAWRLPSLGLVVFGDAVVNLAGRELELLPDKYCTDPKGLRQALAGLLAHPFEIALFAHGDPLLSRASERIRGLI